MKTMTWKLRPDDGLFRAVSGLFVLSMLFALAAPAVSAPPRPEAQSALASFFARVSDYFNSAPSNGATAPAVMATLGAASNDEAPEPCGSALLGQALNIKARILSGEDVRASVPDQRLLAAVYEALAVSESFSSRGRGLSPLQAGFSAYCRKLTNPLEPLPPNPGQSAPAMMFDRRTERLLQAVKGLQNELSRKLPAARRHRARKLLGEAYAWLASSDFRPVALGRK